MLVDKTRGSSSRIFGKCLMIDNQPDLAGVRNCEYEHFASIYPNGETQLTQLFGKVNLNGSALARRVIQHRFLTVLIQGARNSFTMFQISTCHSASSIAAVTVSQPGIEVVHSATPPCKGKSSVAVDDGHKHQENRSLCSPTSKLDRANLPFRCSSTFSFSPVSRNNRGCC